MACPAATRRIMVCNICQLRFDQNVRVDVIHTCVMCYLSDIILEPFRRLVTRDQLPLESIPHATTQTLHYHIFYIVDSLHATDL